MDLARWWRDRRWVGLLDLIDQLPAASRFNEAVLNNPEQAELIANRPGSGEKWAPRVSEYDLHAVLQRETVQALMAVRAAVIASVGGNPGKTPEFPTPVTEVDRAVARAQEAWADRIIAAYTPHALT